jgi:hypothetical protein
MPDLVQGHLRFTPSDFLLSDYQTKITEENVNTSYMGLVKNLQITSEQLALMRDGEIIEHFNTEQNIKNLLRRSLGLITAIAEKEGYLLTDLIN